MCNHPINRRELLGLGLGAAAAMLTVPRALEAFVPRAAATDIDVALQAAKWIRKSRIETANGATWQTAEVSRRERAGGSRQEALRGMLGSYLELMHTNEPVHQWEIAT